MGKTLKQICYILFSLFFLPTCSKEDSDSNTWKEEYRIINESDYSVKITEEVFEGEKIHTIPGNDSLIVIIGKIAMEDYIKRPFQYVSSMLLDSVIVPMLEKNKFSLNYDENFTLISFSEEYRVYRHVISNEDYQYAIEHRLQ